MRVIVNTGPGRLELQEQPLPQPGPAQVRIRTLACGICATDLEMVAGWKRTGFPAIPGHEWAGVVDAAGAGVAADLVGSRCVAENVLADGGEVGFEHPGGYGEYLITEAANVHVLRSRLSPAAATLIEPLAVCVRGLRRLRLAAERRALVIGDGPIGLLMVILLRRAKVDGVFLVGGRPTRLALAEELGASDTLNYHDVGSDLACAVKARFGDPFPAVLEASGSPDAMDAALALAVHAGKILIVGDYGDVRATMPWNHLLHHEIELIGTNASADAWPEAVRLACEESLPLDRLISHRLPVKRFEEGLELVRSCRDAVKVVLEWE